MKFSQVIAQLQRLQAEHTDLVDVKNFGFTVYTLNQLQMHVDALDPPLPAGAVRIRDAGTPPVGEFVLAIRETGYTTARYEFVTAHYDPNYKGWVDARNDRLTDSGAEPFAWMRHPK